MKATGEAASALLYATHPSAAAVRRYCCCLSTLPLYTSLVSLLLLLVLGGELDHVVDAQHGDGRLRGKLDHLHLGERRLDDPRRQVVLNLACGGLGVGVGALSVYLLSFRGPGWGDRSEGEG